MAIGELIPTDQRGRTIVITGASSGIGAAAARRLAAAGATVVAVGRSQERTSAIAKELGTEPVIADFGRLDEVRSASELILARHPRIDVLVNNAGGIVPTRTTSADGHEMTFQGNHLAGFLLTRLLTPALSAGADAALSPRVINTSSFGNRFSRVDLDDLEWTRRRYGNGWLTYCATKLMNIMTVAEIQRRSRDLGIAAVAFHPEPGRDFVPPSGRSTDDGATNFAQDTTMMRLLQRVPFLRGAQLTGYRGSQPLVWLATTPQITVDSSPYYSGMRPSANYHRQGRSAGDAERLWDQSLAMTEP